MTLLKITILFLVNIISRHLYCMQTLQIKEHPSIENLRSFITCPKNQNYENWSHQPLAKKFKKSSAWKEEILSDLFSENEEKNIEALLACQLLLNEVEENNNKIEKKYKKTQCLRWCTIATPLVSFLGQAYFHCYGFWETLFSSSLVSLSTYNITKLNKTSQVHLDHITSLRYIQNEITKRVSQYEKEEIRKKKQQKFIKITPLLEQKQKLQQEIKKIAKEKTIDMKEND